MRKTKAFTYSNVVGVSACCVGLIPDSSTWTRVLSACGILRLGIPGATVDVSPIIVVWVVVAEAIAKDVLIGTRVRRTTAVSSDCKAHVSYTIYPPHIEARHTWLGFSTLCPPKRTNLKSYVEIIMIGFYEIRQIYSKYSRV